MKTLVLLILLNVPVTGKQEIVAAKVMPVKECLAMMHGIWNGPNYRAFIDEEGRDVSTIDAACVPMEKLTPAERKRVIR